MSDSCTPFRDSDYEPNTEEQIKELFENFDLAELDDYEDFLYKDYSQKMTKQEALQIIINTVEGDFSQLSDELKELAILTYGKY